MNEFQTATTTAPAAPKYVTSGEVAERYRVSTETVRRCNGDLNPVRVGRQWRYDRQRVETVFGPWN